MLNKIILLFIVAINSLIIGCGNDYLVSKNQKFLPIDSMPKDERLAQFNQTLGVISNESTAEKAFDEFSSYINTRVDNKSNYKSDDKLYIQSATLMQRLVAIEVAKRKAKLSGLSVDDVEPAIDAEKVAGTINSLIEEHSVEVVSKDGVEMIQNEVRKDIPNIAADNSSQMTPMEAMVVGYVMYSGDDGSATPGSIEFDVPKDKTEQFMQKIIE